VALVFGSSWRVTSGETSAYLDSGLMDIDIVTTNENNEFMVLYSDVSNNGAITLTAGQVSC
jgi:hypothetical protein